MKNQDWSPEKVMKALRAKGTNVAQVAKLYGVSRHALYETLRVPNHRGELRIAHALELHPQAVWPSRYNPAGEPLGRRCELKPIPASNALQCNAANRAVNGNRVDTGVSHETA
ncbi:MAG: helix-turn-helix domain-containing protein [Pseudomonadota bacterium]